MGLRPWEVDLLSVDDTQIYINAYMAGRRELYKAILEAGRMAGFIPASQWNKKIRKMTDTVVFEWDEKTTRIKHDPQQLKKWGENKGLDFSLKVRKDTNYFMSSRMYMRDLSLVLSRHFKNNVKKFINSDV